MKNISKIITGTLVLLGFTTISFGQNSATATVTATIVTPITIIKTADMNFGNIAVTTTGGTAVLSPAGGRTTTGGVSLPATAGTVTAASFNVTGSGSYTYAITLPTTDVVLTRNGGAETLLVNAFTSTPSATGALTGGAQTLNVGATLNINNSGQVPGTYVSANPFTVTVNYN